MRIGIYQTHPGFGAVEQNVAERQGRRGIQKNMTAPLSLLSSDAVAVW
jgi:hypothetical protein